MLLHSSMSNRTQWRKLSEQLMSEYRIIAIDLFGYGGSQFPDPPEQFSLAQEVARIAQILEQRLGEQPFHLIGHSYGGAAALRLTYAQPASILSLGLYEPVAFHLLARDEPAYRLMQQVETQLEELLSVGAIATATARFIDFWSGPGTYAGLTPERQRMLDHYIPKVALDFKALFGEILGVEHYRRLSMPVCLLRSQESPLPTRRVAEVLEKILPRVETHWVRGGHMAPVSHPDEVNPHWIAFLKQLQV